MVVLLDAQKTLLLGRSHRDDQAPAIGELLGKRWWNVGRRRRDHNRVEGSLLRPAERSVADVHVHIAVPKAVQPFGAVCGKDLLHLHGVDFTSQKR